MNKIGWIIFSAVTVLLLGGLVTWNYITNPPIDVSDVAINKVISASDQDGNIGDHTKGNKDGKIVLVEYGDYQCPGCSGAYSNVKELMNEYKDSVTLVFRNFPLTSIHPNAKAAASVAEAAGKQGKYWEMHDTLYEQQNTWSTADATKRQELFTQYAEQLELNIATFNKDLTSSAVTKKIRFDQAVAKKEGVTETPTFVLNGKKLDSETSNGIIKGDLTKVKEQLDALIKK